MNRKILSIMLVAFVLMTTISTMPVSASDGINGIYTYTVSNGKTTITGCNGSASGDIVIPSKLDGHPVNSIGWRAFYNCYRLTSITIPDSVTSIGDFAFYYCRSLTSINIPDSVTNVGSRAFSSCPSLTDVYYTGTEEEWNKITIEGGNENLTNATIHYNYVPSGIKGRVYSSELETPIHNAVVYLYKEDILKGITLTNENGEYSFDADEGSYTVMVHPVYVDTFDMSMYQLIPVYKAVTVTDENADASFDVEFPLYADVNNDNCVNVDDMVEVKASYTGKSNDDSAKVPEDIVADTVSSGISGIVYSTDLQMPLNNALVSVYSDGLLKGVTFTDENGIFTFDIGAGTYTLMVSAAYVDSYDMTMYQFVPKSTDITVTDTGANHISNIKFPIYGDVNNDGKVDINDAVEVRASYTE